MAVRHATRLLLRSGQAPRAFSKAIATNSPQSSFSFSTGFQYEQQQFCPGFLDGFVREDQSFKIGSTGRRQGYCSTSTLLEEHRSAAGQSSEEARTDGNEGAEAAASKGVGDEGLRGDGQPARVGGASSSAAVIADGVRLDDVEEDEEEGLPWARRKSMVQKALNVSSSEDYAQEIISRYKDSGFEMKVIDINRTVKVTKGGKVQSYTVLVVTGNGKGVVGFGKGKSGDVTGAMMKANARALSDLHYFEAFKGHTIFHAQVGKYEQTKLLLWPARQGCGIVAGETVGAILKFAGFKNVKSKVIGSRHPHNTVKATFKTLGLIKTPALMAALDYNEHDDIQAKGRGKSDKYEHFSRIEAGLLFDDLDEVREEAEAAS